MASLRMVLLVNLWMWRGTPGAVDAGSGLGRIVHDELARSRKAAFGLGLAVAIASGVAAALISGAVIEGMVGRHSTLLEMETPGGRFVFVVRGIFVMACGAGAAVLPSIILVRNALRRHPELESSLVDASRRSLERTGRNELGAEKVKAVSGRTLAPLPLRTNLVLAAALAVPSGLLVALAEFTGWQWFRSYALMWGLLALVLLVSVNLGVRSSIILAFILATASAAMWIATGGEDFLLAAGGLGLIGLHSIPTAARGSGQPCAPQNRTN